MQNKRILKKLFVSGFMINMLQQNLLLAADLTALGTTDINSNGKVSNAKNFKEGTFAFGLSFDGADQLRLQDQNHIVSSAHQSSFLTSYAVKNWFQIDLGIRSTTEIVPQGLRSEAMIDESDRKVKETAYAGSRLMLRIGLVEKNNFALTLAPFIEEGLGSKATHAVSRSDKFQGGFLTMLGYGHRGVAEFNLNLGMRYRKPIEIHQEYVVRHEMIGKTSFNVYFNDQISIFTALNARRLMVSDQKSENPKYVGKDSSEVLLGLSGQLSQAMVSAYGGREIAKESQFSTGKNVFGLSFSVLIGGAARKQEISKNNKPAEVKKVKSDVEEYPEMQGEVDTLAEIADEDDDFAVLKKQLQEKRAKEKGQSELSPDLVVEKELQELTEAEQRAELERKNRKTSEAELLELQRKRKADELRKARIEKRAGKVLDKKYSIEAKDVSWDGLEE